MVFVAQVDVDFVDFDGPCGNQHTFKKTVRIAFKIDAIFERARLTFVDIDRHQSRPCLGTYDAPFATGRETGAAQAAQARVFHRFNDGIRRMAARHAGLKQCVTATGFVGCEVDKTISNMFAITRQNRGNDRIDASARHRVLPNHHGGRLFATADTRRGNHAYFATQQRGQLGQ